MDGIGYIGGPQKMSSFPVTGKVDGIEKSVAPQLPQESFTRSVPTEKDLFGSAREVKLGYEIGIDKTPAEIKDPQAQIDYFKKPEIDATKKPITAYEGFYLAGGMDDTSSFFGGFDLNGPSSLGKGIVTLSGENINSPRFLIQE